MDRRQFLKALGVTGLVAANPSLLFAKGEPPRILLPGAPTTISQEIHVPLALPKAGHVLVRLQSSREAFSRIVQSMDRQIMACYLHECGHLDWSVKEVPFDHMLMRTDPRARFLMGFQRRATDGPRDMKLPRDGTSARHHAAVIAASRNPHTIGMERSTDATCLRLEWEYNPN